MNKELDILNSKCEKISKNKIAILSIFLNNKKAISLSSLNDFLQKKAVYCNRSTVYRILNSFVDKKILSQFAIDNGQKVYMLAREGKKNNHNIVCLACGDLSQISFHGLCCKSGGVDLGDFEESYHTINFYGYCKKCRQKN